MKKNLIVLASVAMLSVGLAFYANNSSTMNVLSDNNIEALSDGNGEGNSGYVEYGTYPHRVWIDQETHIVTLEGYKKAKDDNGKYVNDCDASSGKTCQLSTTSTLYNVQHYTEIVLNALKELTNGANIANFIVSLFKK